MPFDAASSARSPCPPRPIPLQWRRTETAAVECDEWSAVEGAQPVRHPGSEQTVAEKALEPHLSAQCYRRGQAIVFGVYNIYGIP